MSHKDIALGALIIGGICAAAISATAIITGIKVALFPPSRVVCPSNVATVSFDNPRETLRERPEKSVVIWF